MPPKRSLSPNTHGKRLIKRKVDPQPRSAREQEYVDRNITRVMHTRIKVRNHLIKLTDKINYNAPDPEERSRLILERSEYRELLEKLDDAYVHWDDIDEDGYDRDNNQNSNYPPPSPPPPSIPFL